MNKHQFPWEECVCYSYESETLQGKLIRKRRKATLLWYISGGGKLSRVRMCDACNQKLSDNTHLRWGLPPGILNDRIWSRFHRVKGSGLGHNSHDLKSLKFLKRWMGWVECWEDYRSSVHSHKSQGKVVLTLLHTFVPGNSFPELGTSCGLSHMTYRWEECTHSGLLSCRDNSGRKQLSPHTTDEENYSS